MGLHGTPSDKGARFSVGGRQAPLARAAAGRMLPTVDTIGVWRFDDPDGADAMLARLERLVAEGVAIIDDAALVSWRLGRRMPSTRELGAIVGPGALWSGSWGVLLGVVFLAPLAGPTLGAAAGAVTGGLADFGLGDDFILQVREALTPGTSAVLVVCGRATAGRLATELGAPVIRAELSQALRYALTEG